MKFKIPFLKNFSFFLLFTLIIVSCNEDFNTVGYDLISTNDFETNKVKLPVYSYQNEFLTDVQVDGLTFQQLGEIDIPNIGRSSAYIASQLSFIPTDFFGLYTPEDELGDVDNVKAIEENEQVISAYLEIPFISNTRDQDGDGVIDSLDADPEDPTSDTDGDSVSDALESQSGTNPLSNDTDGDGILDDVDTDNSGYQPENRTYAIDSVFGNRNASFNLKVDELNYYLNTLDPNNNFESNQAFYSSRDFYEEGFVGENLFDETVQLNFDEIRINFTEDDPDTDIDETTQVETRRSPRIRVPLDTAFFQRRFIDMEGSDSLANAVLFQKYMRGIYVRMENPSDDLYMLLNFASASIGVTYEHDQYNDNDTPDDTTDFSIDRVERSFFLSPGIIVNHLENSSINPEISQTIAQTNGSNKIFVKGGMGLLSSVELLGNFSDGSASSKLEELRENNWLVNEANLVFYVDSTSVENWTSGDLIANRLYLYNKRDTAPLLDYFTDISVSTERNAGKLVHGGILEYENGKPYRYKFKITQHINNLIRKDSTNVTLGLAVSANIDDFTTRKARLNGGSEEILYPASAILNPLSTVLIGSHPSAGFEHLKLELEVIYTDFSN
ncbi:MAG: DUF4270 family protein [Flavobacteriales bacterium]|jgi:hypothetical protein|tara:strand:- start:324 stop:2162 length:1839 start_codon:yes stop_codon:yes gene_type:complete